MYIPLRIGLGSTKATGSTSTWVGWGLCHVCCICVRMCRYNQQETAL